MTGWRLVYIRLTPCADVFRRFQGLMQILRWIKTKAAPTARNVGFRVVLQTGGTAGAKISAGITPPRISRDETLSGLYDGVAFSLHKADTLC